MAKNLDEFTCQTTDSIRTAMLKITANRYRVVIVLDGDQVVGTCSDGDIRRALLRDVMPIAPVEKVMNINCIKTTESDPRQQHAIIQREKITVLPVVDQNNVLVDVALAYEPSFDELDESVKDKK